MANEFDAPRFLKSYFDVLAKSVDKRGWLAVIPYWVYLTKRINHKLAYSDGDGCTNMAESFFSRLRRAEIGIHHHLSGPYLAAYAGEMDWREDNRRISNGEQYLIAANAALKHGVSKQWRGYWNRSR